MGQRRGAGFRSSVIGQCRDCRDTAMTGLIGFGRKILKSSTIEIKHDLRLMERANAIAASAGMGRGADSDQHLKSIVGDLATKHGLPRDQPTMPWPASASAARRRRAPRRTCARARRERPRHRRADGEAGSEGTGTGTLPRADQRKGAQREGHGAAACSTPSCSDARLVVLNLLADPALSGNWRVGHFAPRQGDRYHCEIVPWTKHEDLRTRYAMTA